MAQQILYEVGKHPLHIKGLVFLSIKMFLLSFTVAEHVANKAHRLNNIDRHVTLYKPRRPRPLYNDRLIIKGNVDLIDLNSLGNLIGCFPYCCIQTQTFSSPLSFKLKYNTNSLLHCFGVQSRNHVS